MGIFDKEKAVTLKKTAKKKVETRGRKKNPPERERVAIYFGLESQDVDFLMSLDEDMFDLRMSQHQRAKRIVTKFIDERKKEVK